MLAKLEVSIANAHIFITLNTVTEMFILKTLTPYKWFVIKWIPDDFVATFLGLFNLALNFAILTSKIILCEYDSSMNYAFMAGFQVKHVSPYSKMSYWV